MTSSNVSSVTLKKDHLYFISFISLKNTICVLYILSALANFKQHISVIFA